MAKDNFSNHAQDYASYRPTYPVELIDLSAPQIENAEQKPKINYQVSTAEKTPFENRSFNLITVAQALHWFNIDAFLTEMRRISKPDCVLSIWGYGKSLVNEDIDLLFNDFHLKKLEMYWDPERDHIEAEYEDLELPLQRVNHPQFNIEVFWTREQYINYIQTWSAVKHFKKANGFDPTLVLAKEFELLWPDDEVRKINFPIFIYQGSLQ